MSATESRSPTVAPSKKTGKNSPSTVQQVTASADERWFAAAESSALWLSRIPAGRQYRTQFELHRPGDQANTPSAVDAPDISGWTGVALHPRGDWLAANTRSISGLSEKAWTSHIYFFDPDADEWISGSFWFPAQGPRSTLELSGFVRQLQPYADGSMLAVLESHLIKLFAVTLSNVSLHRGRRVILNELGQLHLDGLWSHLLRLSTGFLNKMITDPIEGPARSFSRLALSSDGRLVAAAIKGRRKNESEGTGEIHIWDGRSQRLLCELTSHEERYKLGDLSMEIDALVMHPDGRWLFSAGRSGLIRRWTLTETAGGLRAECDLAMEALPDGQWVVWHDPDGPNRRWVKPAPEARRWLGWRMPSRDGNPPEYRPFDAFSSA